MKGFKQIISNFDKMTEFCNSSSLVVKQEYENEVERRKQSEIILKQAQDLKLQN